MQNDPNIDNLTILNTMVYTSMKNMINSQKYIHLIPSFVIETCQTKNKMLLTEVTAHKS